MYRFTAAVTAAMLLLVALPGMNAATAQTAEGVVQTLDRTQVHSSDALIEMDFAGIEMTDFVDTGIRATTAFTACKLTALGGTYCLDGKTIRNFPDTSDPSSSFAVIDCEDPALGLDDKKPDTCTGLTVDLDGAIWIAGKNKGKSHSLFKAVEKDDLGDCPSSQWTPLAGNYCALEFATGRPLLVDINPVDGDVAAAFPLGNGVVGLEERKTIVFFPNSFGAQPVEIASGKQEIPLAGNEQLLSVALWQSPDATDNRILVTTDRGRVLAVPVGSGGAIGTITEAFDVPDARTLRGPFDPVAAQCSTEDASYGIRASAKSGIVYVTDRQYCEVLALLPDETAAGFTLTEAQQPCLQPGCLESDTEDLTLSTADGSLGIFPPEAPTVAPGISVDLRDCADSCALIVADDGEPAFSLSAVAIESTESGLTLFQIKNIPDCRYVPERCETLLGLPDLVAAGVVVPLAAGAGPAAQLLNLTPLLPTEITDLFDDSGVAPEGLPPMYVSRQYRGQKDRVDADGNPQPFTFEAFFGIAAPGVIFRGVFEEFYDTAGLTGDELGCSDQADVSPPTTLADLLAWDIVTTVSERYITFTDPVLTGGIGTPQRVDSMTNVACGSSKAAGQRWSIKPYNLEITPCTWNSGAAGEIWVSDGTCPLPPGADPASVAELPDDAVFAKLLIQLFDDLREVQNQLACVDVDSGIAGLMPSPTDPPLPATTCATLDADWLNAKDKLGKCWDATQQPKQSAGDQNCQAFESQLANYEGALSAATRFGPDPANRIGELRARLQVIRFLYAERFVPSIPATGYDEPPAP